MDLAKVRERLGTLKEEQSQREQQVAQWQEQIDKLTNAIRQTKEAHDFTRGQIAALEGVLEPVEEDEGIEDVKLS